ncbi:MAG TPA: hypothetical protein VMV61_09755 [Patescibacteria group bacterium]|nr:hypothetical protein [Patescibacteria group bacterium]
MKRLDRWAACTVLFAAFLACISSLAPRARASGDEPETVVVTYRPQPGKEDALLQVLREARSTRARLALADDSPYLLVRAGSPGNVRFIEVFTWKSEEIPDHAPQEIRDQWDRMQKLVRPLDGHPGIDFEQVQILPPK